jgi:hypothetical protein
MMCGSSWILKAHRSNAKIRDTEGRFAPFARLGGWRETFKASEHTYITDTTAENLSGKVLNSVNLVLYVFDKTHARIGDGNIKRVLLTQRDPVTH